MTMEPTTRRLLCDVCEAVGEIDRIADTITLAADGLDGDEFEKTAMLYLAENLRGQVREVSDCLDALSARIDPRKLEAVE